MGYFQLQFSTRGSPPLFDKNAGEQQVGGLVAPGFCLATGGGTGESKKDIEIEAGVFVNVDELGDLVADCHGYPLIEHPDSEKGSGKAESSKALSLSLLPLIDIAPDKSTAFLHLLPVQEGEKLPELSLIEEALSWRRVIFGIDKDAIQNGIDELTAEQKPVLGLKIAGCKAPVHGKDAFLRFHVEIGPVAGKILANGSIDFRERRLFVGVKKDQVIATKVPATEGVAGRDVEGNSLPAREGIDIGVTVSDAASFDEDTLSIKAVEAGVLSVVNDQGICVSSMQKIEGDVDYSTGNVRSQHSVEIVGSVLPGFTVSVKGDLLVGGKIESAVINCRGNLVVKGGVIGEKTSIRIRGDGDFIYLEQGEIQAGGNVVIRANSYYSNLLVGGDLFCESKVKLVGGSIVVSGSIKAGQAGAGKSNPMFLAAGVDPRIYKRYTDLKNLQTSLSEIIQKHNHRYGDDKSNEKKIVYELEELDEIENELEFINLVSQQTMCKDLILKEEYSTAYIEISGLLAAGTIVRIGNVSDIVNRDVTDIRVMQNLSNGAIEYASMKKG